MRSKRFLVFLISAAGFAVLAYATAIVAMNYGIDVRIPHWVARLTRG